MSDRGGMVAALVGGVFVGGGIVAALAMRKGRELEVRGQLLSASLTSQGSAIETVLAAQGAQMQPRLAAYAEQAANDHLAQAYGLTPQRIQGLQTLFQRFGIR